MNVAKVRFRSEFATLRHHGLPGSDSIENRRAKRSRSRPVRGVVSAGDKVRVADPEAVRWDARRGDGTADGACVPGRASSAAEGGKEAGPRDSAGG